MIGSDEIAKLGAFTKINRKLPYEDKEGKAEGNEEETSSRREKKVYTQRDQQTPQRATLQRRLVKQQSNPIGTLRATPKKLFHRRTSARDGFLRGNEPVDSKSSKPSPLEVDSDQFQAEPNPLEAGSGSSKAETALLEAEAGSSRRQSERSGAGPRLLEAEPDLLEVEPDPFEAESDPFDDMIKSRHTEQYSNHRTIVRPHADTSTGIAQSHVRRTQARSKQIHVIGTDITGRYIAHALAGCLAIPPVRYLIHKPSLWEKWIKGSGISVHRGDNVETRDRIVGEYISQPTGYRPLFAEPRSKDHIENLIVTLSSDHVLNVLSLVADRIDHRTTICLMGDGLGIAEVLQERMFRNPLTRPAIVLGHATHSLAFIPRDNFAVREVMHGRVYLTAYDAMPDIYGQKHHKITQHPPIEMQPRRMEGLQLLCAIPDLAAGGHRLDTFFRQKLPITAFRAVADPLTAIMDCTYDMVRENSHCKQLIGKGLEEICSVVSRLPMVKLSEELTTFTRDLLWQKALHKLTRKQSATSNMRWAVSTGNDSDIDFLTGYFIRVGKVVGVRTPTLDAIMLMFKSLHTERRAEYKRSIPFDDAEHKFK